MYELVRVGSLGPGITKLLRLGGLHSLSNAWFVPDVHYFYRILFYLHKKTKFSFGKKSNFSFAKKEGSICDMLLKCSKICCQNPWGASVSNFKAVSSIVFFIIIILHRYTYIFHKQSVCKKPVLTRWIPSILNSQ